MNSVKQNLFKTIMPLYILSKLLSLAPYNLKGKKDQIHFITNYGIVSIIHLTLIISVVVYGSYFMEDEDVKLDNRGLTLRFELYMDIILIATIVFTIFFNQILIINSIDRIIDVDTYMTKLGIKILYKNARKFCIYQLIGITSLFFSKVIIQYFNPSIIVFTIYSIFNIVDYINTISLFQFVNFILLLWQRYKWLNMKMKELRKTVLMKYTYDKVIEYSKDFPKRKWTNSGFDDVQYNKNESVDLFQELTKVHMELYYIGVRINRAYSPLLLATVAMRFIMLITQLLHFYKIITGKKDPDATILNQTLIVLFIFLHFSKIFMISVASSYTVSESQNMSTEIHKLWECNSFLRKHINGMSLQILQQNMRFHAAGFFSLNYVLIYNVAGALTTYLVMLVQFDFSGQATQNNCTDINNSTVV